MQNLVINPKTRVALENYQKRPTHAVLLAGPIGVGLGTIAGKLAKTLAGANIIRIAPKLHKPQKTANINIDDIRGIRKIAAIRTESHMAVVIDEAEQMTYQTPEALLKLLEEPSDNIYFILTTHLPDKLPATVMSRVQRINVLPADRGDCRILTDTIKIPTKRQQIEFLASGLPAEIHRLIGDEQYFRAQARNFEIAKAFIGAKAYGRLRQVSSIKTRNEATDFVNALARLVAILSEKQPRPDALELISDVLDNLAQNGNVRAQLTYLATNMVQ